MALEYTITLVDRCSAEANPVDTQNVIPTITSPPGQGWRLHSLTNGDFQMILTWVKGGNAVTVTADYTIAVNDEILLINAQSGNLTLVLPAADSELRFDIKKIDSTGNSVTITPVSSETIDGYSSYSINTPMAAITLVSDGSNWFVV